MEELNEEKVLEVRMYFFVPYNISPIQQAIQSGHAALRYARMFSAEHPEVWDFVDNHETWIILNGGTTNDERDFDNVPAGTMNQIADQLQKNDIMFSYFIEPDLNHALTALCFLADEKVFNYKDYPNFVDHIIETSGQNEFGNSFPIETIKKSNEELIAEYPSIYKSWVREMGGIKNIFLRELIKGKKLA